MNYLQSQRFVAGHCSSYGVYLNDDFDSSIVLNTNFWYSTVTSVYNDIKLTMKLHGFDLRSSSSSGVLVQKACTSISSNAILSGNVLVFGATADTSRQLVKQLANALTSCVVIYLVLYARRANGSILRTPK